MFIGEGECCSRIDKERSLYMQRVQDGAKSRSRSCSFFVGRICRRRFRRRGRCFLGAFLLVSSQNRLYPTQKSAKGLRIEAGVKANDRNQRCQSQVGFLSRLGDGIGRHENQPGRRQRIHSESPHDCCEVRGRQDASDRICWWLDRAIRVKGYGETAPVTNSTQKG